MGKNKSSVRRPGESRRQAGDSGSRRRGAAWLYGVHAVAAALANPARGPARLAATREGADRLSRVRANAQPEIVDRRALERLLPPGAVHQGVALECGPPEQPALESLIAGAPSRCVVIVLDRVSDPHNVGAVLRSAAAFGALAVLQAERGSPGATGVLAKAASGALEVVPLVSVTNLARALEALASGGFWRIGLDGAAQKTLAECNPSGRVALVLGAEGGGLRRLTREHCDLLARLPTGGPVNSLNVSNAAAVALYELARR